MNLSTYECFPQEYPSAIVRETKATLTGEGCTSVVNLTGSRTERIALLKSWARAEGCDLIIGNPIPERHASPDGWYNGRSGTRTGD